MHSEFKITSGHNSKNSNSSHLGNCSTPNPNSKLPVWGEHYNCQDPYPTTTLLLLDPVCTFGRKKFIAEPPLKILTPNFQGKVFEI